MYYSIEPDGDKDGNMMGLRYAKDHPGRSWVSGAIFLNRNDTPIFKSQPKEPIEIIIKEGRENAPLPSFLHEPLPIMSKKLFEKLNQIGVDNIDVYETNLLYSDGSIASKDLLAFNLIGLVAAIDLSKAIYDPNQPDSFISMSFEKLEIKKDLPTSLLMFRLIENVTTILVHERVKSYIEKAHIGYVRFFRYDEVGIL